VRSGNPPIDQSIDLNALPGSRPLLITGDTCCAANGDPPASVRIELRDAAGNFLGYVGGCMAQSSTGGGKVVSATAMALQKIPENAARARVTITTSGDSRNSADTHLYIFNSR
jgi:hypothetical protein